jgi:hypothetical protein
MYLHEPVFFHGQLYVAMSRATLRKNIKILVKPPNTIEENDDTNKSEKKKGKKNAKVKTKKNEKKYIPNGNGTFTKSIVYKEVLTS